MTDDTLKGYSTRYGKSEIVEWFKTCTDVRRILDIGAGSGTYSKLLKQESKLCVNSEWVAVEAWQPYIKEFNLESLYDTVINEDARKLDWENIGKFSVAIAGDVLEHMSKDEAVSLVDKILSHSKILIISLPIRFMPQEEIAGNPFEVHVKPDWSHVEVIDTWGDKIKQMYLKSPKSKQAVYWLSND